MILYCPNHFGQVQIVLEGSNLFWIRPNHFGQVQIVQISRYKSNLNLSKMIYTRPKLFGCVQNNLYPCKTIWMVQNHFGPIEGQGIKKFYIPSTIVAENELLRTAI